VRAYQVNFLSLIAFLIYFIMMLMTVFNLCGKYKNLYPIQKCPKLSRKIEYMDKKLSELMVRVFCFKR